MGNGIVRLQAENVKRLRAVEITPDGNVVTISGRNEQGKSSVLDAIWMALGGKKAFPRRPVREGQDHATIRLELEGGMVVTRTIKPDGETKLTVTATDGARYGSPQELLDGLVKGLSFDPLAFSLMKPAVQRELLRELVGLDFTELESKRNGAYEQRTQANREVKRLEGELSGVPQHPDAPAEEISVGAIAEELRLSELHRQTIDGAERESGVFVRTLLAAEEHARGLQKKLEELRAEISKVEERIEQGTRVVIPRHREAVEKAEAALEELRAHAPDDAAIRARLAGAESINAQVRDNRRRTELAAKRAGASAAAAELTGKIESYDDAKRKAISEAKYPLEGLSVDDHGVLLNGVPFEQGSSAGQLRASVAIGLALNPKLKVLLVRNGSLLDADALALLTQMATESGAQVWLEVVSKGGEIGVVIEDGAVVGAHAAPTATMNGAMQ